MFGCDQRQARVMLGHRSGKEALSGAFVLVLNQTLTSFPIASSCWCRFVLSSLMHYAKSTLRGCHYGSSSRSNVLILLILLDLTRKKSLLQNICEGLSSHCSQHSAYEQQQYSVNATCSHYLTFTVSPGTCKPIPSAQFEHPRRTFLSPPLPRLELRRPAQADAQSSLPFCSS